MLRVLLNKFHQGPIEQIVRYLPKEDSKAILAQEIHTKDASIALLQPELVIQRVHYSWIVYAFHRLPKIFYSALLGILPLEQAENVHSLLNGSFPIQKPKAPLLRGYFTNLLYHSLEPTEVLPVEYLPQTPLTGLSELSKKELVEVIDFLGIYDLAEEMRNIIDKHRLRQLQPCLSPKQKQFLRTCLHKPEKIATSRLELSKWDGDCRKLQQLLHRRGLLRLGKALSSQHPDLVWHIAHILDTGRGEILLKHHSTAAIPGVTPVLVQQVVNVINFLNIHPKSIP